MRVLAVCHKSRVDLTMLGHITTPRRLPLESGGSINTNGAPPLSSFIGAASLSEVHFQPLLGRRWSAIVPSFSHAVTLPAHKAGDKLHDTSVTKIEET